MTSPNKLEDMTDEQLSQELSKALNELEGALMTGAEMASGSQAPAEPAPAPAAEPMAAAAAPATAAPAQITGDMMMMIEPETLQQATAKMVAMGLLDVATDQLTPELLSAFQIVIDAIDPGLFNLQQPEQLKEFIDGVNSGAIDLAIAVNRARELSGAGGVPVPTGTGVPIGASAGFVPGGVFAPAGAVPAGAVPATVGLGVPAGAPIPR
tara:strand:- start:3228 stop:3857 length:630 start_codon:yes stop_codon:yes gene_type:complete